MNQPDIARLERECSLPIDQVIKDAEDAIRVIKIEYGCREHASCRQGPGRVASIDGRETWQVWFPPKPSCRVEPEAHLMTDGVQTYRVGDAWVAAQGDWWVPGSYDSPETARLACSFTEKQLSTLAHVWQYDGEDRPATRADLEGIVQ